MNIKPLMMAVAVSLGLWTVAGVGIAHATQPSPEHKVTICHAHPADTAASGYNEIEVDVASVGYQQSGHQDEHDADIIPPWSYTVGESTFSYDGKNWTDEGQAIWNNHCEVPSSTTTEPPTTTTTVVSSTTSVAPTTTAPPSSSPTVVSSTPPGASASPATTPELAFTGHNLAAIIGEAVAGVLAISLGLFLYFEAKRREGQGHWTYKP